MQQVRGCSCSKAPTLTQHDCLCFVLFFFTSPLYRTHFCFSKANSSSKEMNRQTLIRTCLEVCKIQEEISPLRASPSASPCTLP